MQYERIKAAVERRSCGAIIHDEASERDQSHDGFNVPKKVLQRADEVKAR